MLSKILKAPVAICSSLLSLQKFKEQQSIGQQGKDWRLTLFFMLGGPHNLKKGANGNHSEDRSYKVPFPHKLQCRWWISDCQISFWKFTIIDGLSSWLSFPLPSKSIDSTKVNSCVHHCAMFMFELRALHFGNVLMGCSWSLCLYYSSIIFYIF